MILGGVEDMEQKLLEMDTAEQGKLKRDRVLAQATFTINILLLIAKVCALSYLKSNVLNGVKQAQNVELVFQNVPFQDLLSICIYKEHLKHF